MSANIITPRSQPAVILVDLISPAIRVLLRCADGASDPGTARMLLCLAAQIAQLQRGRKGDA